MAVSVRMDPLLERELELKAKRLGVTKSQFIIDAVQRALGRTDPYALMLKLQAEEARGIYDAPFDPDLAYAGPYNADTARAFIVKKLKAKHGLGDAG